MPTLETALTQKAAANGVTLKRSGMMGMALTLNDGFIVPDPNLQHRSS